MIAVSSSGTGFRALAAYLVHGRTGLEEGRIGWASARNLPTDDPEVAATLMRATAAQNVRGEKPVYHLALAFDPGDPVDRATMERVADRVLARLHLDEHQALIVSHRDREHAHLHILVNRVHPESGRLWDRWQDMPTIQQVLREEERALGLRQVPGHLHAHGPGLETERTILRDGTRSTHEAAHTMSSGTGSERAVAESTSDTRRPTRTSSLVDRARNALPAVRDAASWEQVERVLADAGLRLERRGSGLVVTDGERLAKASSVSPELTLRQLETRLGPTARDTTDVAHRADERPRVEPRAPRPEPAAKIAVAVPAFAPVVEGAKGANLDRVARDVAQLERVYDVAAAQRESAQAHGAERARLAQFEAAVERWSRASRALDGALARAFSDPARARVVFDDAARAEGVEVAAARLRERPESYGELSAVERSRALGLVRQRDETIARRAASEAATLALEWGVAGRTFARAVGQGRAADTLHQAANAEAIGTERARRVRQLEIASAREHALSSQRRDLPAVDALERGIREAIRRLTPAEIRQLHDALTRPQVAIVMRIRQTVKEAILGRERGE